MKVTPLEIRQKAFEKKLRGYDKDEVNAYMQSLSQEWERLIEENKDLRVRLENAEKDVQRLREVEASLFKTLKTAEDTGANMIDQANKSAELQVRQAQMQADALLNDARNQARDMIEEAESKVKDRIESSKDKLRILEADCKLIDNHRDNLLIELRGVANDIIDRVEKLKTKKTNLPELDSKNVDLDGGAISFDELSEEHTHAAGKEVVFDIDNSNKVIDEETAAQLNESVVDQEEEVSETDQIQEPSYNSEEGEQQQEEQEEPTESEEIDVAEDVESESNQENQEADDEVEIEEQQSSGEKSGKDQGSFFDSI